MLISNFIYAEINILVFSQSGLKSGDPYGFSTNIKKRDHLYLKPTFFLKTISSTRCFTGGIKKRDKQYAEVRTVQFRNSQWKQFCF